MPDNSQLKNRASARSYIHVVQCTLTIRATRVSEHITAARLENQQSVAPRHSTEIKYSMTLNKTEAIVKNQTDNIYIIREALKQ
jgi:hypothetical protein